MGDFATAPILHTGVRSGGKSAAAFQGTGKASEQPGRGRETAGWRGGGAREPTERLRMRTRTLCGQRALLLRLRRENAGKTIRAHVGQDGEGFTCSGDGVLKIDIKMVNAVLSRRVPSEWRHPYAIFPFFLMLAVFGHFFLKKATRVGS